MAGRPRRVSDEQVFAAVAEVIDRMGPTRLTLAAVGDAVGVTAPALAQRFGSKRELLLAFAAAQRSATTEAFDRAASSHRSPIDTLLTALATLGGRVAERSAIANNLAFLQLDLVDDDFRAHAVTQSRELRRRIHDVLDRAVADGELEPTDTGRLSEVIHTTYHGALMTWAVDGRGSLGAWIRRHVRQVMP